MRAVPPPRLALLQARSAPVAVILRRGPSKRVEVIRWDLSADARYTYAWTAVSRAPWLTALALWPKGDCWWGGGLFTSDRALWLNHRPDEATHEPELPPGPLDWLDWGPRGRLLALSGGRVWTSAVTDGRVERFRERLDLRNDRPEERDAPERARRWKG
jgi:hypothetical protein